MRISDWSSDVCSSDLAIVAVVGLFIARGAAAGNAGYFGGLAIFLFAVLAIFALIGAAYGPWPMPNRNPLPADAALRWVMGGAVALLAEIGSAAVRERVCQYG